MEGRAIFAQKSAGFWEFSFKEGRYEAFANAAFFSRFLRLWKQYGALCLNEYCRDTLQVNSMCPKMPICREFTGVRAYNGVLP